MGQGAEGLWMRVVVMWQWVVMGQEVLMGGNDSEDPLQLITTHQPKPAASAAIGSQVKKPAPGQSKPAVVVAQPAGIVGKYGKFFKQICLFDIHLLKRIDQWEDVLLFFAFILLG